MGSDRIDIKLKESVSVICDHLIEDLGVSEVPINEAEDFYWEIPPHVLHDTSHQPKQLDVGRLSDDLQLSGLIKRGASADVSYSLIHIAPLLRYVAEKVKA